MDISTLTKRERDTLLLLLGCNGTLPIWDIGGKYEAKGWVNEKGLLTEAGIAIARQVALDDPEVTDKFKAKVMDEMFREQCDHDGELGWTPDGYVCVDCGTNVGPEVR